MKNLLFNFLISLIALIIAVGIMVGMYFFAPRELKPEWDLGTVVYSEAANTSSVAVDVKLSNNGEQYGIVAKSFNYMIRFSDSEGKTLYEEIISVNEAIKREPYEKSIKFAADGDYAPISGRVENVTVEIVSAEFMNLCQYAVEYEGENFGEKLPQRILFSVGALFAFMLAILFLDIAGNFDSILGKIFMWVLFIAFVLLFSFLYYYGMRYLVIWLLPNF